MGDIFTVRNRVSAGGAFRIFKSLVDFFCCGGNGVIVFDENIDLLNLGTEFFDLIEINDD